MSQNDKFYEQVAMELQNKSLVPELWAKANSDAHGNELQARALYIQLRVAQLRDEVAEGKNAEFPAAAKPAFRRILVVIATAISAVISMFFLFIFVRGLFEPPSDDPLMRSLEPFIGFVIVILGLIFAGLTFLLIKMN
jgi:hypothetical protein